MSKYLRVSPPASSNSLTGKIEAHADELWPYEPANLKGTGWNGHEIYQKIGIIKEIEVPGKDLSFSVGSTYKDGEGHAIKILDSNFRMHDGLLYIIGMVYFAPYDRNEVRFYYQDGRCFTFPYNRERDIIPEKSAPTKELKLILDREDL